MGNRRKKQNERNTVSTYTIKGGVMPPLALAEGVGPSICRFGYPNVPRYHVATINQRLTAKIHFFLISEHTFLFFHSSSLHRSSLFHRLIASSFFIVEYALWIRSVEAAFCRRPTLSVTPHGSVGWHVAISTHTAVVTRRIPTPHRHGVECRRRARQLSTVARVPSEEVLCVSRISARAYHVVSS